MHTARSAGSFLALVALLAGAPWACAPDNSSGGDGGSGNGNDVDGSIDGDYLLSDSVGWDPLAGTNVRISFDDGEFSFSAGCNSHFGQYTILDGAFLTDGLGSTEMGCDALLHDQDEWLADFFESGPTIAHASPRVVFTTDTVTLTFLDDEIAEPDLPLTGTIWNIDTLIDGDAATGAFGYDAALVFTADGTFSIDGPCNTLAGSFTVGDDALLLTDVSTTDAACTEPGKADFEAHLGDVFAAGTVTYDIDSNHLSVDRGDVGVRALGESTEVR